MNLYIPACGDRFKLTEDWTFALFLESRNMKFAGHRSLLSQDEKGKDAVYTGERYTSALAFRLCTLKAGSVLEVDRVYVRQHSKSASSVDNDYDSITFKVVGEKNGRFWAKLADCNAIACEQESTYRERNAAEPA